MKRARYFVLFLAWLIINWSVPAAAQNTPYKYQFTPYLWLSGLDGTVGARDRTVEVDASPRDVLDHLEFALMGGFDARLGRWRILIDSLYVNVGGEKGFPRAPFINASVDTKTFIFDSEGGYRIFSKEGTNLDATAGIRFWHLKNQLGLARGAESLSLEHARGWVDPIVGLRFNSDLPKRLFVTAKADIGGFSTAARLDWQAYGGIGMSVNDHIVVDVGYRNLSVDYKNNGFVYDSGMRGVVVALGIRF